MGYFWGLGKVLRLFWGLLMYVNILDMYWKFICNLLLAKKIKKTSFSTIFAIFSTDRQTTRPRRVHIEARSPELKNNDENKSLWQQDHDLNPGMTHFWRNKFGQCTSVKSVSGVNWNSPISVLHHFFFYYTTCASRQICMSKYWKQAMAEQGRTQSLSAKLNLV